MPEPPRRGRRPGAPDTRAEIVGAARVLFGEQGYAATSVRSVAAAAGVDKSLVSHYFPGGKDDLFLEAMEIPVDPRLLAATVAADGPEGAGERLMRLFVSVWDDPTTQVPLLGVVRGIVEPDGQRLVRDLFLRMVLQPIAADLDLDEPERRLAHVASQLVGLAVVRHLVAVEPLASMPAEQVVATYAPVVQRFLTGPLP